MGLYSITPTQNRNLCLYFRTHKFKLIVYIFPPLHMWLSDTCLDKFWSLWWNVLQYGFAFTEFSVTNSTDVADLWICDTGVSVRPLVRLLCLDALWRSHRSLRHVVPVLADRSAAPFIFIFCTIFNPFKYQICLNNILKLCSCFMGNKASALQLPAG